MFTLLLLGLIALAGMANCIAMMAGLRLDAELTEQAVREYDEERRANERL